MKMKQIKNYHHGQVTKDVITKANKSGLVTKIGKRKITLSDTKELVEDIISGKIGKYDARKMYNNIADDAIH